MQFSIGIAIPTYQRGDILVETISRIFSLEPAPSELLIIDQTPRHSVAVESALDEWNHRGRLRWIRLDRPTIPGAMNRALLEATSEIVLFLDDDVRPSDQLIASHAGPYSDQATWAVVGQLLQPGDQPVDELEKTAARGFEKGLEFPFYSSRGTFVENVMAGNLSVRRDRAISLGGFDENFVGAAYRFETDFAKRLVAAGGRIWFEPSAAVHHLRYSQGGVRSFGDHLKTSSPAHAVGDYYFALVHGGWGDAAGYIARRLFGSVVTRFHLTHPWWIVPKMIGEVRGLLLARRLIQSGRKLLNRSQVASRR